MLTSVCFTGYRRFDHYTVDGLKRVNLFVGKNNSGKTSLLEGMAFLCAKGDPWLVQAVAERRQELKGLVEKNGDHRATLLEVVDVRHFFYGHTLIPQSPAILDGSLGYGQAKMDVETGQLRLSWRPDATATGVPPRVKEFPFTPSGYVDLMAQSVRHLTPPSPTDPLPFVGTSSLGMADLSLLWDEVILRGLDSEVIAGLRVLDPKIESVHMLAERGGTGVVLGLAGEKGRVPLGSMGEGIHRMLALSLALACAKGGPLFVDEIDTALHYSVHAAVWKLVIKKALETGTQVFATTHSWDGLLGLSQVCAAQPELAEHVAVHKVAPHLKASSIPFTGEEVVESATVKVELR